MFRKNVNKTAQVMVVPRTMIFGGQSIREMAQLLAKWAIVLCVCGFAMRSENVVVVNVGIVLSRNTDASFGAMLLEGSNSIFSTPSKSHKLIVISNANDTQFEYQ